jgi:hypothetical protein
LGFIEVTVERAKAKLAGVALREGVAADTYRATAQGGVRGLFGEVTKIHSAHGFGSVCVIQIVDDKGAGLELEPRYGSAA